MIANEDLTYGERIRKISNDYDKWVKKIRILPTTAYEVTIGLSIVILLYFKIDLISWQAGILIYLIGKSLWVLGYRYGHKEGYLEGCVNAGYHDMNEEVGDD